MDIRDKFTISELEGKVKPYYILRYESIDDNDDDFEGEDD